MSMEILDVKFSPTASVTLLEKSCHVCFSGPHELSASLLFSVALLLNIINSAFGLVAILVQ